MNKPAPRTSKFKPRHRGKTRHGFLKNTHKDAQGPFYIYGLHAVRAALDHKARRKNKLFATSNGLKRLEESGSINIMVIERTPKQLDKIVGPDAVHQGVVLDVEPLARPALTDLHDTHVLVLLDQVTDPHNVGAILRTACAFNAGAVITTSRNAPQETATLAKTASGALDLIPFIEVRNLNRAMEELDEIGFTLIGFDSEADRALGDQARPDKVAIILGAEGKGLRQKTRALCHQLVRLDMQGPIKSLNVSNAAAIALFAMTMDQHETEQN